MESRTPRRTKRQDSLQFEFLLPSPPSLLSPPACVSLELLSCGRQSSISEPPYIMDRARVLLELVIMPLVPPTPKKWSGVTPFPIQFYGVSLTWLPCAWKTLTPKQKLQSWEFAVVGDRWCLFQPCLCPQDHFCWQVQFSMLVWVKEVDCLCSIAASRALNSGNEGFLVMMEATLQKRNK